MTSSSHIRKPKTYKKEHAAENKKKIPKESAIKLKRKKKNNNNPVVQFPFAFPFWHTKANQPTTLSFKCICQLLKVKIAMRKL